MTWDSRGERWQSPTSTERMRRGRLALVVSFVALSVALLATGKWWWIVLAIVWGVPLLYGLLVVLMFGGVLLGVILLDLWDWLNAEQKPSGS